GASFSPPGPCGTSRRRRALTWVCSLGGTAPRSRVACSWRRRPSRRASSPARTRMQTSISPLRSSTRRWARRGLASVCTIAAATCARPQPPAAPLPPGSGLTVMNRVPVESYLAGVLGGEIGIRRAEEAQALVAQAVVSRSFALKNRGRWEALGFDAWADVRDQVYNGVSGETPEVWSAVRRTTGEVLEYDGEIIEAYFHSTCGGSTAAAEEAFKAARGRPYLRPISDASGGGHHYCDVSPRFRWREEWDGTKLRSILSRTRPPGRDHAAGGDGLQRITDVAVTGTGPSGRVTELRIVWEDGDVRVRGPDVRAVLRPEPDRLLQSTAFQLFVTRQDGQVTRLVAAGTGSGHGLGLCQWGAIGRARAGQDYRKILTTYFPGTRLERLY